MDKIQFTDDTQGATICPYARARQIYEQEPCARTFDQDFEAHLVGGYVICTPRLFLMGRPVNTSAPADRIVDPSVVHSYPNCWHVYVAVGQIGEFFKHEPFPLDWFSWERHNELRIYPRERVTRLCQSITQRS